MSCANGDAGLSNERTALSWQRTALSLIAACAIMARLTWSTLGPVAITVLAVALVLSVLVFVESRARYSHDAGIRNRQASRGGRASLALAVATLLIAATELTALSAR